MAVGPIAPEGNETRVAKQTKTTQAVCACLITFAVFGAAFLLTPVELQSHGQRAATIPPEVACSPDTPTVFEGERAELTAWARSPSFAADKLRYAWRST